MRPLPLRVTLPAALALAGAALTATMVAYEVGHTGDDIHAETRDRARSLGNLAVTSLERSVLQQRFGDVDDEVARLALVPYVQRVLVIDEEGRIMHASDFSLRGTLLRETSAAGAAPLVTRALASTWALTDESDDGRLVRAAVPLNAQLRLGALRPATRAVLLLEMDLAQQWALARVAIVRLAAIMSAIALVAWLIAWLYLRSTFTRQFDRLRDGVTAYGRGDHAARIPVLGNDELSTIGRILNDVFADLSSQQLALKESETRFRSLFQNAPLLMSLSTIDTGRFVDANEAFARITGYSRDELLTMQSTQIGWSSPSERLRMIAELRERGRVDGIEMQVRTKDGRLLDCLFHAEAVTIGGREFLLAIVQDVTSRKEMEQALKRSEAMFRAVIDGSNDGVTFADARGTMIYRSPSAAAMTGYPDDEVLGVNAFTHIHLEDLPRAQAAWKSLLRTPGGRVSVGFRYQHKDGGWRHIETSAHNLLHDPSARLIVLTSRDVTERRQAEEEQKRLEAMLMQAQRLEAVGTLAGGVAHDFNNILTAMSVNLDFLMEEDGVSDSLRSGLQDLRSESNRASSLTRQLLLFSRRQTMEVKAMEVNSLVVQLAKMLRRLIGENIELVLSTDATPQWIEGDAGMIEQVVTNLVVNSRDALPGGGRIAIRTRALDVDASQAARSIDARPGRFVCIEVADNGTGMDHETAQRIFEPFFTTKAEGKGTGLGLATVHGIVKQHQGWIELDTSLGEGSRFRIFIPAIEERNDELATARKDDVLRGRGERILLVEDDAAIRRLLVPALQQAGYDVVAASSGPEATQRWSDAGHEFDLLVSDIVMPGGMDGLELAHLLLGEVPALKVILMTGYSPDLARSDLLTRQGVYFLSKPLDTRALLTTVREALRTR